MQVKLRGTQLDTQPPILGVIGQQESAFGAEASVVGIYMMTFTLIATRQQFRSLSHLDEARWNMHIVTTGYGFMAKKSSNHGGANEDVHASRK